MRRLTLMVLALVAVGCSDIGTPTRPIPYESRLFVPFDDNGTPAVDSLRFHWPTGGAAVRYWVEDSLDAPALVSNAIARWRSAFLYHEWDGTLVGDSSQADVIVRITNPPVKPAPLRLDALRPECEGATDVDTVATRTQFLVPVRVYVNPKFQSDDLGLCMAITLTHELGHSLGLFQHSSDPGDIMFSDPQVEALSDRDVSTVETLYHRRSDMVPVRPQTPAAPNR